MTIQRVQTGFFIAMLTAVTVLVFLVFKPIFGILFLSLIFAIIAYPLNHMMRRYFSRYDSLSALLSVCAVVVFILIPLAFFTFLLFQESVELLRSVQDVDRAGVISTFLATIESYVHIFFPDAEINLLQYVDIPSIVQQVVGWITHNIGSLFSSVFKLVLGIFIMLVSLFYLFKDGEKFVAQFKKISPLDNHYDEIILNKVKDAVNSVIRGHIIIGVLQGIMTGIGLTLFGVPSAVIWGFVAAIASFIPTVGTGIVLVPAVAYLFFTHGILYALGMTAWGIVAVGLIDNLIGPVLIQRGIKIHPLVILLSVLGGLELFGPIGFIAGPVAVALFVALITIYPLILNNSREADVTINLK